MLLCACYVCGLKNEQQKLLGETNKPKLEAFAGSDEKETNRPPADRKDAKTTEKPVAEETTQETEETPYPLLLTPKGTKNIEFAIESEDIFCIYNGEKYGYLKKNGEEITEYIYDAAYPFSEGLACVMINGKYGFINEKGEEALPLIYEDAAPFQEGLAYFATEDEYGFMTKDGSLAFCPECDSVSSFQEGLAYFSIDGKYGYIDKKGQVVIEPLYSDADYFKDGIAFIEIDGCKGAIDTKGEIVIPVKYDSMSRSGEYICALSGNVVLPEAYAYYTLSGDIVSQEEYMNRNLSDHAALQNENENIASADNEENKRVLLQEKLEGIYDYVGDIHNGRAEVKLGEYYGIVDGNGELLVPVEYDFVILYVDGSYCLQQAEDMFLYSYEQELLYKMYGVDENSYSSRYSITMIKDGYKIQDDNRIVIIDKRGNKLLSVTCDYAANRIYRDNTNYILYRYGNDKQDRILILEENKETDISDTLLKNSITPRMELYWKLTHGKNVEVVNPDHEVTNTNLYNTWNEFNYLKKMKLHTVSRSELPILYCYEEPCISVGFPMSDSALYGIGDNQLQCLVRGEECGGSARGDYVCFWKDVQSGEILIGNRGAAGGFGGYAGYSSIYEYEEGKAAILFYYEWIRQSSENYAQQDLYNNAHLFYDDNDIPYTKDSIQETESVNEYSVNEERVSLQAYEDACSQYRYFTVY